MDINKLAGLGKGLHTRIRTFFDTPLDHDATPMEICQAVLDQIEHRVQPLGRGRRLFPYTGLHVRVRASESAQPSIEAAFTDLSARVFERLGEIRCEAPGPLEVQVTCVAEPPESWALGQLFEVEYEASADKGASLRRPPPDAIVSESPPGLRVSILVGTATAPEFTFGEATVSIGRSTDPTDENGRVRRNRIAFLDVIDGVNETVGRAHARLRFDPDVREYRLFDEGSSNGTSIVRDGDVITVHRRDPRGVRVRSGDEIQVGRALLRVEIEDGSST